MELDSQSKEKLSKQPFIMRKAVDYLLGVIDTIVNGKCDEEALTSLIMTANNNANGKFSNNDLVNYDEACVLLGMQTTNRTGLHKLCLKNNIHQQRINNLPVGFRRDQILALKDKIDLDMELRSFKEQRRRDKEAEKIRKREALYEKIMGRKPIKKSDIEED